MIAFVNTFLSYLVLTLISICVIVAAVISGKKLREIKDNKDAAASEVNEAASQKEE